MDTQGMTMFYDVCRLCLDRRGGHCMFENQELPEDIFACTGIRVKSTDQLPRTICDICLDTINKAKELRKLATNNDTHLRLLFDEELNSDDEARLVIDESCDKTEDINTIQIILDEDILIDRNNSPPKSIGVRKDLFTTSTPNDSPDSSSSANEIPEKPPKHRKIVLVDGDKDIRKRVDPGSIDSSSRANEITEKLPKKRKKVLVVDGNKDITKRFKEEFDVQYQCPTCHKEFDTYKKLYLHQRLHNKTIACPDCPKKFATKGDMEKHRRVHTGERPFACDVCDRRFKQKVTLKQHKETVHQGIVADDESD